MYTSADIDKVLSLLGKYRVQYVFVGPTERKEYPALGLEKFAQMHGFMSIIYSNPDVVIYKVHDYGTSLNLDELTEGNQALKDLKDRMAEREREEKEKAQKQEADRKERMQNMPPRNLFQGAEGTARGLFLEPRSLGVAPDGTIFVGDFRNHRVQKFSSDYSWSTMWGKTGNQTGQFKDICDVAASADKVFVLDTFNNRIQVFDFNGKFIKTMKIPAGSMSHPRGIAVSDDKLYVADTGNSRIVVFNNSGKLLNVIGRVGKGPIQFSNPIGIDIVDGEIYVADVGNKRIQVLKTDGTFAREYPVQGWNAEVFNEPYLAVGKDKTIWYSDPTKQIVYGLNQDGKIIKNFHKDSRGRKFGLPMGLALTPDNKLLVVDARNHKVQVVELNPRSKKPSKPSTSNRKKEKDINSGRRLTNKRK